jgi:predicted dehydrogenase
MSSSHDRREFLRRALLAGTALPFSGRLLGQEETGRDRKRRERREKRKQAAKDPVSERLDLGVIAVAGRGGENLAEVSSQNIVAICDIDRKHLDAARARHPEAKAYTDYRRVLDHTDIDAVVISTPDHMHAIPAVAALRAGLDVYCEKPLAHSVREVRLMRKTAAGKKRITQMGTQIHAGENYRRVVEIVQSGVLGKIPRVHVWQGTRPIPGKRVEDGAPPDHIDYDLWLGPAPFRPFHPSHFHFNWRYWFDFGGGAFADMACHYMDLPHWALGLRAPLTIEARGEKDYEGDNDVPGKLRVDYHYAAPESGPGKGTPVHLTFHQGGLLPEGGEVYKRDSAVLFEGEKGRLLADYGTHRYYFDDKRDDPPPPPRSISPSPGHQREWIEAVRSRGATSCNFDYSGTLAEAVLLGNVAYRSGMKLEWDAKTARITNAPAAERFLEREYRKGWSL